MVIAEKVFVQILPIFMAPFYFIVPVSHGNKKALITTVSWR